METRENNMQINILLPLCVESLCDVFFNVLKISIERSRLDDLVNALKIGMNDGEFLISSEDFSSKWNESPSIDRQARQARILAFWAIENFSALGRKFYGASWKPPKRKMVHVVGESNLNIDQIDALVLQKLKPRLFQINDVSPSTYKKLRHLAVTVPSNLGKNTEIEITARIKLFEIDDDWIEESWKALKCGKFSMDTSSEHHVDYQANLIQTPSDPSDSHREVHSISCPSALTRKRVYVECASDVNGNGIVSAQKRPNTDNVSNGDVNFVSESINTYQSVQKAVQSSQANVAVDNEGAVEQRNARSEWAVEITREKSNIDSMQVAVLEMRKEVGQLAELLRSVVADQKDSEIARLKASNNELLQTKENLMCERQILKNQSEEQTALIAALQKAIDAFSKLQVQSDTDLSTSVEANNRTHLELAQLKSQFEALNLAKDAALNSNTKLQQDLKSLQEDSTTLVSAMQVHVSGLEERVATAEKINANVNEQNSKLQEELCSLTSVKDAELADLRSRMQLLLSEKQSFNVETDMRNKSDVELQVDMYSEHCKHVEVQTDAHTGRDVELQTDFSSGSRKEIGTQTDPYNQVITESTEGRDDVDETSNDSSADTNNSPAEPVFQTHDPAVLECRNSLKNLQFGWMTFHPQVNKFCPGFVHPPDSEGIRKAQKVTANGYVSKTKFKFSDFSERLPDDKKEKAELASLKKFNKKFNFCYV